MLFSGVDELEWMCKMCVILGSDVNYINSALSIICFTCSNILLYMNVITHSQCVFVFGLIVICSGEPSHDKFHVRAGETQSVIETCSDKCDIGAQDFTSHVIFSVNDIVVLCFLFQFFYYYYSFSMDDLVLSRDNFVVFIRTISTMFSLSECEPFIF